MDFENNVNMLDNDLYDTSILEFIEKNSDELSKKITVQYGIKIYWDGTMNLPSSGGTVMVLRYGDTVIEGKEYLDSSYRERDENFDSIDLSKQIHPTNKEIVLSVLKDNEEALEMFCRDYNIDILKAGYTLCNFGPKVKEALGKYFDDKLLGNNGPSL